MGDYVPTTEEVRLEYMAVRWGKNDIVSFDARAEFDRMIASVERAAAEKAWDRCVGEMPIDPDWKNFYGDNNPYRAEAYRQERKEQ